MPETSAERQLAAAREATERAKCRLDAAERNYLIARRLMLDARAAVNHERLLRRQYAQ